MEINGINKYCHVSAYIAYDNCSPVYKQTFKFELSPSTHNSHDLGENNQNTQEKRNKCGA